MKTIFTAAIILANLLLTGSTFAKPITNEYSPEDIAKTVEIELTDSALEVDQSGRQVYTITDFDKEKCELYTAREGNKKRIYISLLPKGSEPCRGSISVKIPKGMSLKIKTLSGNTVLKSLKNEITAESVSGDISATGLALNAHLSTISGNISSAWTKFTENEDISAETKSGDIQLFFPAKAIMSISAQSASGHVNNGLKMNSTDKGAARVAASSDSGNITLGYK